MQNPPEDEERQALGTSHRNSTESYDTRESTCSGHHSAKPVQLATKIQWRLSLTVAGPEKLREACDQRVNPGNEAQATGSGTPGSVHGSTGQQDLPVALSLFHHCKSDSCTQWSGASKTIAVVIDISLSFDKRLAIPA